MSPATVGGNDGVPFNSPAPYDGNGKGNYFDEVSVTLNVPRIGAIELPALVYKDQLYLPVKELFDFLRLKNEISPDYDIVRGFFIDPKNSFFIEKTNNRIAYQGKTLEITSRDMIRTEDNLYLRSNFFGEVFGLDCVFDFRNLAVTLITKIELPVMREMQQELMHKNMMRLGGQRKTDTVVGRSYPLFKFGMADWAVISSQQTSEPSSTRASLALGSVLAGGELNLWLNYFSGKKLDARQQSYQWRYVNNDYAPLRQLTVGKLYPRSTASLFAPLIGGQITNASTNYRKSFGTFTWSNATEPGWTVELYVNNVLINYTKADASGFYTFEVPMVYGNSLMKLRFYGLYGEQQELEKYITVPFNFIPLHEFEYTLTGGVVEDRDHGKFMRARGIYGLTRRVTVGAGVEYLSTVASGKTMPFAEASMVLGSQMLISAEYAFGARSRLSLNYRLASNLQFDAVYTRYAKGQTAISVPQTEEKKLVVSLPFHAHHFNAFSRLSLVQLTFPSLQQTAGKAFTKNTSAELLFSGSVSSVTANITTYAQFNLPKHPLSYSNLSVAFRLPKGFRIAPQAQYEFRTAGFSILKAELGKNLGSNGYVNISYQKDMVNSSNNMMSLGLRYNFSFAQAFFSSSRSSKSTITSASARGSLMYEGQTKYVGFSNQNQVGRAGIEILPFLDLNCNGKREADEPKIAGLKIQVNGGHIENENKTGDTVIRISGLESYATYFVEVDKNSFDNIAWQVKKPVIKVITDANLMKLIEVAVAVEAEVSGRVSIERKGEVNGQGRVIVNIYNKDGDFILKTLSEADGYFSYVGLAPGDYFAVIDKGQMTKLNMVSTPGHAFHVSKNRDGDIIGGLDFLIKMKEK